LTVRDGEKGPVEIEMVKRQVQTRSERKRTGAEEWRVVTRRPFSDDGPLESRASRDATDQDARHRYHDYLTPTRVSEAELKEPSLAELARVIKAGVCIEACFKRGKGEVGMDEYQVRTWQGWHQPYGAVADGGVVLDRGNPPRAAVDAGFAPTTSALWAEPYS
jgi:hypothetical protein